MNDDLPIKKKQLIEGNRDRLNTLPNKYYSMSRDQKRILVAVIGVLVAMIAYPPFYVIYKNGVVFNMGYGWIFDPPKQYSVTATVNVSMLLIQWLGVLIVGGVAFFLIKGTSVTLLSSPKKSTVTTTPKEKLREEVEDLYKAMLGEKNCAYYLKKFELFDQKASGLKASWNWAAFFGGGIWILYRKMYGWFFAFWGFGTILAVILRILKEAGSSGLPAIVFIAFWVTFTIYADSLYHRNIKKKIAIAQLTLRDEPKLLEFLHHKGGVHTWVLWVFTLMPVTGILAAIAIPNFIAYKERRQNTATESKPAESVPAQVIREKTGTALKERKIQSLSEWNEIEKSPEYWEYSPEDRSIIKSQWFKENIATTPEFQAFSPKDQDIIMKEFNKPDKEPKSSYKKEKSGGNAAVKGVSSKRSVKAHNTSTVKLIPVDYDPFAKETARDGRFIAYDNGTVSDTRTNLMWVAKDNGAGINWQEAKKYCENYRGGGYTDWRMPTRAELAGLYDTAKTYKSACGYDVHSTELIQLSACCSWASETHDFGTACFNFGNGLNLVPRSGDFTNVRALPVRSGK